MKELKVISLFSGYGTQELALKYSGINYRVIANCDILNSANTAYDSLHKSEIGNLGDISKVDEKNFPDCDLLTYSFPCFTGDTLVLTGDGYKRIDQILPGDSVLTHTNKYKNVARIFDQGKKETWKIDAMSFDTLRTTENHRFYVRTKEGDTLSVPYWKECKDLRKGDYMGVAINQNDKIPVWEGVTFKWKDGRGDRHKNELGELMPNLDFWWVIGRYIGDGWQRQQGGIVISCSSINEELAEVTERLDRINFSYNVSTEGSVHKIHIPKKEIGEFTEQFGKYAHGKRLNSTVLDLPKNLMASFLDGYHSADGSLFKKGSTRHRVSTVSRELAYGIAQCIAKAYGIAYSIHKTQNEDRYLIEGREVNQRDYFTVVYDFTDPEKKRSYVDGGYIWFPFYGAEKTGEVENVYDIEVEDDHSFTANGCIAHNCQDISISGIQRGIKKGTRSGLLYEVERIVEHKRPKYLLMENVKNLVSKNHMVPFNKYIEKLQSLGYGNTWIILNGADFGCAQNRERVFMFSVLGEDTLDVREKMAGVHRMKTKRVAMRDFLEPDADGSLFINPPYEINRVKKSTVCNLVARRTDIKYDQTRRIYGIDGCSPCLTTSGSPQIMLDDKRIRTLTAREGYRFMGVKDSDIDKLLGTKLSTNQHIALAGNSICVPVMQAIFEQFLGEYKNDYIENLEDDEDFSI